MVGPVGLPPAHNRLEKPSQMLPSDKFFLPLPACPASGSQSDSLIHSTLSASVMQDPALVLYFIFLLFFKLLQIADFLILLLKFILCI